jgi:hypothetical protein
LFGVLKKGLEVDVVWVGEEDVGWRGFGGGRRFYGRRASINELVGLLARLPIS